MFFDSQSKTVFQGRKQMKPFIAELYRLELESNRNRALTSISLIVREALRISYSFFCKP